MIRGHRLGLRALRSVVARCLGCIDMGLSIGLRDL